MNPRRNALTWPVLLFGLLAAVSLCAGTISCGDDDDDDDDDDGAICPDTNLAIDVCALDAGPFSVLIDNEFLPYEVGAHMVLEGEDDGDTIRVEIDVLDETETIGDVETRVVTETEYENDELIETSRNWFAQAEDGTVCYFGEDVDIYENDEIVAHDGAWKAGVDGAEAGIVMPGDPQVGQVFYQEYYPGNALDSSAIAAFGEAIDLPAGSFTDTLSALDYNELEGECEGERKVYVSGIGLAIDEEAELTEY